MSLKVCKVSNEKEVGIGPPSGISMEYTYASALQMEALNIKFIFSPGFFITEIPGNRIIDLGRGKRGPERIKNIEKVSFIR